MLHRLKAKLARAKTTWEHSKPYVMIVLKQLKYPALLAVFYTILAYQFDDKHRDATLVTAHFLPSLFFIMWFVALYERARKKRGDDDQFSGIRGDISSIIGSLKELQPHPTPTPAPTEVAAPSPATDPTAIHRPTASSISTFSAVNHIEVLLKEAKGAFQAGFHRAALLQAGTAFELSVRAFAASGGEKNAKQASLLQLLRAIHDRLPQGWGTEIQMLRQLRNELAHGYEALSINLEDAGYVMKLYETVIRLLEEPMSRAGYAMDHSSIIHSREDD